MDSRPDAIQEPEENKNIYTTIEEPEVVVLSTQWPERKVDVGANLSEDMKGKFIEFLKTNVDCVVWSHFDMTGISLEVMTHKLNEPTYLHVKQKKRKQGTFKNQAIPDVVPKLLKIGSIREVKYPN